MTYKQWITTTVAKFQIGADEVDLILCNQSTLIPDPEATVVVRTAKTALCKEIATLIPLYNIGEGGYSISWNWEAIKFWYNTTCDELGLPNSSKPKIRNKSTVW